MNIPLLKGGLCNQLFQIAATYAHSLKHNQEFGINYNLQFAASQGKHPKTYKDTIYKKIQSSSLIPEATFAYSGHQFKQIPVKDNLLIDGYFQSYKFFEEYYKEVSSLLVFPESTKNRIKKVLQNIDTPICTLHIRRGDYIHLAPHHMVCTSSYYLECIDRIKAKTPETTFIVITDDKQSVYAEFKSLFDKGELIISNTADELDDLYILTQSQFIIGSNSSFSWWGTFLNNKKTISYFPEVWFGPEGIREYGHPELYLDNMTKVPIINQ